jgi:hypothetical protein
MDRDSGCAESNERVSGPRFFVAAKIELRLIETRYRAFPLSGLMRRPPGLLAAPIAARPVHVARPSSLHSAIRTR